MEDKVFGRYRLVELLGRGGMGEVWRAFDSETNRLVAVKVLPAQLAVDPTFGDRFRREANAAAGLNNPHVIPIHHFGEIDGRLYVDMRLVEGRDLQQVLREGPLDPVRAVGIVEQVASALHAAHRIGLVHRDVKPSNVLLDDEDFAYLIDFGIARSTDETGLTGTGNVIGTWAYLAPERITAGRLDPRSDVYALACVLHECLTGQQPFPANSLEQQIGAHLTTPPPQPSQLGLGIPDRFDAVIAAGMAKDPEQRYSTTKELARAAREALTVPAPLTHGPAPGPASPVQSTPTTKPAPPKAARTTEPPTRMAATRKGPAPLEPVSPTEPTRAADSMRATSAAAASPAEQSPPPAGPQWWRRKSVMISAAAVTVATIIVATVGITHKTTTAVGDKPTAAAPIYGAQLTLPLAGLQLPSGVAVDNSGAVYVTATESGHNQVLKLASGSFTATTLPFAGLTSASGVAVDFTGAVYVTDGYLVSNSRVLKLAADASAATELPFTGPPWGIAVDGQGAVYVTDDGNGRLLKLPAGASAAISLPFTYLQFPAGVAVDAAGAVYVAVRGNSKILRLPPGGSVATELPFTGLDRPAGLAVDVSGAVYVADEGHSRVLKLAAGASAATEVPFTGLLEPQGVAVDTSGDVFVADYRNNRVLKLPKL